MKGAQGFIPFSCATVSSIK
uniref:Uncharacterized protein n=1 Tax=Anguilla anguilla TaxID=7936 RepID=A0A0E9SL81_ANGAN